MNDPSAFIPPHGNYRELLSYRKAEIVYDLTFRFCHRFVDKTDRTMDQMIQAARSGKQNIAEGSKASGISKETEIKPTGVARASLEELLPTIAISFGSGIFPFGKKKVARPASFGDSATSRM